MRRLLSLALALLCLPAAPALAAPVFTRDPMTFLKQRHRADLRRPGNAVKRKFQAMSETDVAFFRGGAPLFYRDLTDLPALKRPVTLPLMGDLHLENVGAFRTAAGIDTFDFNDFDEAFTGPYTWELARGAVSVRLHARANGLGEAAQGRLVARFLTRYLTQLGAMTPARLKQPLSAAEVPGPAAKVVASLKDADTPAEHLADYAMRGRLRLNREAVALPAPTIRGLAASMESFARLRPEKPGYFAVKDAARKLTGLASLSRMRFLVLAEGPSTADGDDVLLDLKEEGIPASAPWTPAPAGSQGERVAKAWAYFVPGSDKLIGVMPGGGGDFLVRAMTPWREAVDVESLKSEAPFAAYVDAVALVAARAHARSGKAALIVKDAGEPTKLVALLGTFAEDYALQVKADREVFKGYVDP